MRPAFFAAATKIRTQTITASNTLRSSDGGGLKRITIAPHRRGLDEDVPIGYSTSGSRILFDRIARSTHLGSLFTVKPNGTGLLQLSPQRLLVPQGVTSWSPNGSQVTFGAFWKVSAHGSQSALFVVNADGTSLRRITTFGIGAVAGATWSPYGRLIAFTSKFRGSPQIWVVRPNGACLRQLTHPTQRMATSPSTRRGHRTAQSSYFPVSIRKSTEAKRTCGSSARTAVTSSNSRIHPSLSTKTRPAGVRLPAVSCGIFHRPHRDVLQFDFV
jgi:WD40-like Beta Propeller Repeat